MTFGALPRLLPLLVGGGVGGLLGWRLFRARVRYSLYDEVPAGMSRDEYARRLRRAARLKTLLRVILCAAAGALIASSLSSMIR
jgi:hypothetical protein